VNFYNEHDPKAAAWLRELIKHGQIPNGVVDERSIEDIAPSELDGFTQCHFFAGIGGVEQSPPACGSPNHYPAMERVLPLPAFLLGRQRRRV